MDSKTRRVTVGVCRFSQQYENHRKTAELKNAELHMSALLNVHIAATLCPSICKYEQLTILAAEHSSSIHERCRMRGNCNTNLDGCEAAAASMPCHRAIVSTPLVRQCDLWKAGSSRASQSLHPCRCEDREVRNDSRLPGCDPIMTGGKARSRSTACRERIMTDMQ